MAGRFTSKSSAIFFLGQPDGFILENGVEMFYVCCSRAKKNLVVFYHKPSNNVLTKAKDWFGRGNVQEVSE
jgi:DNA helicase-2/ATP-dependent DNA helicase PcrA